MTKFSLAVMAVISGIGLTLLAANTFISPEKSAPERDVKIVEVEKRGALPAEGIKKWEKGAAQNRLSSSYSNEKAINLENGEFQSTFDMWVLWLERLKKDDLSSSDLVDALVNALREETGDEVYQDIYRAFFNDYVSDGAKRLILSVLCTEIGH